MIQPRKESKTFNMSDNETTIIDLLLDGRGVADQEGKKVFIPFTIPGERVTYQPRKKKKKFDEARLLEVLEPAAERVEAKCEYFTLCGGCTSQHIEIGAQLAFKQASVVETLRRIGRVEAKQIYPPISDKVWGYRRRARLAVKYVEKKGRALVGFREKDAPYVADMLSCEVLHPNIANLISPLSDLISAFSIKAKVPQIECSVAENATSMVFRVLDAPSEKDLELLASFSQEHSIRVYLQTKGLDTVKALNDEVFEESLYFALPVGDLRIEFSPVDFIQVHHEINQRMVHQAIDWLDLKPHDRVLDLFCGLGNFTLPIATQVSKVLGIEGDEKLVERARHNATINSCEQAEFEVVDLFKVDENSEWLKQHWDAVVIDPPRAGAREVIMSLDKVAPAKILYVSCHPGTLARDAELLVHELGYECVRLGVMDMFPHTGHVETMALFTKV